MYSIIDKCSGYGGYGTADSLIIKACQFRPGVEGRQELSRPISGHFFFKIPAIWRNFSYLKQYSFHKILNNLLQMPTNFCFYLTKLKKNSLKTVS